MIIFPLISPSNAFLSYISCSYHSMYNVELPKYTYTFSLYIFPCCNSYHEVQALTRKKVFMGFSWLQKNIRIIPQASPWPLPSSLHQHPVEGLDIHREIVGPEYDWDFMTHFQTPWRPRFTPMAVHVGSIENKVALGQVCLESFCFSLSKSFYHCSIFTHVFPGVWVMGHYQPQILKE